jgi:hypothetical protein
MTRRLYAGPAGLLISRVGYEAVPGMPEAGKAFDSNWPFAGLVVGSGSYSDPAPPLTRPNGNVTPEWTATATPRTLVIGQSIANAYSHLAVIFMWLNTLGEQRIDVLPAFFATANTLTSPRKFEILTNGVNNPQSNAYERFTAPRGFVVLGA